MQPREDYVPPIGPRPPLTPPGFAVAPIEGSPEASFAQFQPPPMSIAPMEPVPPDIGGMAGELPPPPPEVPTVGSHLTDPDNPYMPMTYVPQPYVPPSLNKWERDPVTGRPTAVRLGVNPEMGGMPREQDRLYASSNVLMQQVLATLPPIFQQFAGRHIGRFDVSDVYGYPSNEGGYYQGNPTPAPRGPGRAVQPTPSPTPAPRIEVGRGNEQVAQRQPGYDAQSVARHELIHALSFEVEPFARDAQNDFQLLRYATQQSWASLHGPQYHMLAADVQGNAAKNDWGHVFTSLAETALRGQPLPPALQQYFAPMFAAVGGRAPMSPPPVMRP